MIADHPTNYLPRLGFAEIKSKEIEPKCVAKELGFEEVLSSRSIDGIIDADRKLVDNGYTFIGYHGTNTENLRSMFSEGLNPIYCGSGDGEARGSGFYIARSPGLANDYADSSTLSGEPQPPRYEASRYEGERGQQELTRVYAKNFALFKLGQDLAWGVESSDGDPNGDRKVQSNDTSHCGLEINTHDLEMVVSPSKYHELAILPSLYSVRCEELLSGMQKWPNYKDV
ncbi:hypothetical protein QNN88_10310 [Citrobacter sp. ANG330]|uniref:hypothetical protein n=1 Tax=Citrobacter sp. ANG330 TaxID=3048142 RepID=UPI0039C217DD